MKIIVLRLITGILLIAGFQACSFTNAEVTLDPVFTADSTADASCPYITTNAEGKPVICWIEENDNASLMYFAVSGQEGKKFSNPIAIPTSTGVYRNDENLAKIIFKKSGEIIAVFGRSNPNPNNKYSGLVFYTQSFDDGKSWSSARPLVTDTTSYDQRYFDLTLLPDGEAAIIWLDSRLKNGKDGSTLFFAKTKGRNGFTEEKPLAQTICPCCRTKLFTDAEGNIHAAFRDIINDSIRDMVHFVSKDGGNTFSEPERISADNWKINGCPHTGPTMAQNRNGLHFAWYTMGGGEGVFYCNSKDNGATFTNRESISANGSARHPQITALANGNLVLVWDELDEKATKPTHRIGMQLRSSEGKIINTQIISAADENASFPVVLPIDDKEEILVAYTVNKKNRQQLALRRIYTNNL